MKRHGDDDDFNSFGGTSGGQGTKMGKRQRPDSYQEALAAGKYEARLLVSSKGAGGIIGKGGENIKRLRSQVRTFF
ncbi:unnamed protein product [Gongylonema pulchrum]|uniref:KH_dom_type_1 domain-containing protein n=1 Tax=Gongylonema pulchrum TaxID=637853 RepID=A0A183DG41_9BILA|nr:unnamed protein product [Gongylonema pulchrum]